MVKQKSNIGQCSIKNMTKCLKVLPLEDTRFHYNVTADFTSTVTVGLTNVICVYCNAKQFKRKVYISVAVKVVYN